MANECLKAIEAAAAGRLSDDELALALADLDEVRRAHKAEGKLDTLEAALLKEAGEIAQDMDLARAAEQRRTLQNAIVKARVKTMARTAAAKFDDPSLALEAITVGINRRLDGGRRSVDADGKAKYRNVMSALVSDLKRDGVFVEFTRADAALEDDVAAELFDVSQAAPTGRATGNQTAKKIAAAVHKAQTATLEMQNRSGALIRKRQGRITRQSHDRARMERAGKDAWITEIEGKLDWAVMRVPEAERRKMLEATYSALVTGVRKDVSGTDGDDVRFVFKGPGNLARKAASSRVLHFRSSADFMAYHRRFGIGNLRESIAHDIMSGARNAALMEQLGPSPRAMFDNIRKDLMEEFRDRPDMVKKLQRKSLDWFMDQVDGTANHSNNHSLSSIAAGFRMLQSVSKLGGAIISQVADIAATMSERRFQGRSVGDAWMDALKATVQGFKGGDQRVFMDRLATMADISSGDIAMRFGSFDDMPGNMARLQSLFFKLNLQQPTTDATKRGVIGMMSRDLAEVSGQAFDALPGPMRRNLQSYGFDAKTWEIARAAVGEGPDGRMYILPDMVAGVDGPVFSGMSKNKQAKVKAQVADMLQAWFLDRADAASPTPGAREKAFLHMGTERGTLIGELVRFAVQFKSFPTTILTRVVGRDLADKDFVGLANFMAGAWALGFLAMQAKQMAAGKEPREVNVQSLLAGFVQGGGGGIYADFLFGETNRYGRSFLGTLAGPTLGLIDQIVNIKDSMIAGEDVGAKLFNLVKSHVPGANLFYAKAAMDYLIFYQIQEAMNPGFLRRMERRIKKENNAEFFIPPTSVIPRGGGSRIFEGVR